MAEQDEANEYKMHSKSKFSRHTKRVTESAILDSDSGSLEARQDENAIKIY